MPNMITALLARPDTTVQDAVPTADGGSWAQTTWDTINGIPTGIWYALAAAIITIGLISSIRIAAGRKRNIRSLRGDKFMTFLAAGVSTSVVATGMWKFFGDVLHIGNPVARGALFAVFEIAMLASAFRSRRFRLDRAAKREADPGHVDKRIDVDGIAVWVLAGVSGVFAAADETSNTAKAVRIVVPLLAAWMWERGLAGELMQFTRGAKRLNLRLTPERILVWLGIAEPASRGIDEVARRRRIARFARTAFRLHLLTENPTEGGSVRRARIGWLRWRLRRQTESGNEHLNLAGDQAALHDVRLQIALLYGAEEGTSRDAVRELTPLMPVRRVAISDKPETSPTGTPVTSPSEGGRLAMDIATRSDTAVANPPANDPASAPATEVATAPAGADANDLAEEDANDAAGQVATDGATKTARKPATQRVRKVATDVAVPGVHPNVIRLAKYLAKYPGETNAELAKRMRVGDRTVSRYRADAEAYNLANVRPESRPEHPLVATPIPDPKPAVKSGTNGHSYLSKENS